MKNAVTLTLLLLLVFAPCFARAADMPKPGAEAPGFTLPNQEGTTIALGSFRGKWVVLYFYPKDFTGGCSLEAHNFQEDLARYAALNAVIVGVSADTVDSHKSFCAKEGLNFVLLADTDHQVSASYGSVMEMKGNTLSARHTFLVDPKGVIRMTYEDVHPDNHSQQVLADLAKLQDSGQAAPAISK